MASSLLTKERMASIKGVNRWAWVARSPDSHYMAAGTMAGDVDLSSSSSANLEIFKLDFQSDDWELPVVAKCPSSERFNRLAWGKNGSASDGFDLGLIAGALVDGNIDLWNPLTMISPEATESAFVGRLVRHKGHVRGLEFNAIAPNLLASGAEDGEICIWDLANPAEPTHFPRLMDSVSASLAEISFLSWNSVARDLLASTSYNGATVLWDQRNSKPVMSFSDEVRRRCSVLQWNPDDGNKLIVASDEDSSPSLKVWDIRYTVKPWREFSGHSKGVIAMSWCPHDDSYLLTCAKDFRTICWNTRFGEIVCELPAGIHWNYDVHWYPNKPGVISASSFDGKISIYNIEVILTENTLKKDPKRGDSLANLIKMHESGDYSLESLLEMIAFHLGVVDAEYDTWKVFSSCFSELSPGEEDCISSCPAKNDGCGGHSQQCSFSRTPKIFTQGPSGDNWKGRCRWWLTRHFSNSILKSEIRKRDLQLITYKAACASYMYGEEFDYVAKACSHLEKENEKDLLLIVDKHKQRSFGFYREVLKWRSDLKKYRDYMSDRAAQCSIHEEN